MTSEHVATSTVSPLDAIPEVPADHLASDLTSTAPVELDESIDNRNLNRELDDDAPPVTSIPQRAESPKGETQQSDAAAAIDEPKAAVNTTETEKEQEIVQNAAVEATQRRHHELTPEQRYFDDGMPKPSPPRQSIVEVSHFKDVFMCHVFKLADGDTTVRAMHAISNAFGKGAPGRILFIKRRFAFSTFI